MKLKCRFWFVILPPYNFRRTYKLVGSCSCSISSCHCRKPKLTFWTDFEPRFGWLRHFLMIIPQHIRARSSLYNPVGGPVAATHKQTSPTPHWKAHAGRVCEPPFLCSQFVVELEPRAERRLSHPQETNPRDLEAQHSDSSTVERLFVSGNMLPRSDLAPQAQRSHSHSFR